MKNLNINFALLYRLSKKPKKAIEYLESKGLKITWDWQDLWEKAHQRAFTVAKVVRMDLLKDIKEATEKALKEGTTFAQYKKNLVPKLVDAGWWGKATDPITGDKIQLGSKSRLKTIFQTNLNTSYQAGRWGQMVGNSDNRPYLEYSSMNDMVVRPDHERLNGFVFHIDDPFWSYFYPPNGFNCRCRVRALTAEQAGKKKISTSTGQLKDKEVTISGDIKGKVKNYKGIQPDPGWSYNPGMINYEPDLKKYPPDIRKLFN